MSNRLKTGPLILPNDADWMAAAARLGLRGRPLSRPNPSVGCIVVRDGIVTGRGWTQAGGRPHGEAMALAQAGDAARGAVLYTTLEPCAHPSQRGPTCSHLIADAGISRVIFACPDPDSRTSGKGAAILENAGVSVEQLNCKQAQVGLEGYLSLRTLGRPHITLKLAMSLDGQIAMASGESQWITGPQARAHVHARRAQSDAILVGGGTWRSDAPSLTVRLAGLEHRSPKRLVLTRSGPIDGAAVLAQPEDVFGLEDIQYLYIEGGAGAAAAFIAADLVDRLEIYRAPIIIGHGASALSDIGLQALSDAHGQWQLNEQRQLGSDIFEAYVRTR